MEVSLGAENAVEEKDGFTGATRDRRQAWSFRRGPRPRGSQEVNLDGGGCRERDQLVRDFGSTYKIGGDALATVAIFGVVRSQSLDPLRTHHRAYYACGEHQDNPAPETATGYHAGDYSSSLVAVRERFNRHAVYRGLQLSRKGIPGLPNNRLTGEETETRENAPRTPRTFWDHSTI